MKQPLLIIGFIIHSITTFSQSNEPLRGIYIGDRDTLHFYQDSIHFSIMSNGGWLLPMEGMGKFTQIEDILLIRTEKNHLKTSSDKTPQVFGDRVYPEYKTLIFKMHSSVNDTLKLTLFGITENKNFKGKKTIKKLERSATKFKYRQRVLLKAHEVQ